MKKTTELHPAIMRMTIDFDKELYNELVSYAKARNLSSIEDAVLNILFIKFFGNVSSHSSLNETTTLLT
jgi:hypothetical protein